MGDLIATYTAEIKRLISNAAMDIIAIGENLLLVKAQLPHGRWYAWLGEEFGWSVDTAQRMMRAAQWSKCRTVRHLPIETGALYLLSEKTTPEAVVEEVLSMARDGTVMTQGKVKELMIDYQRRLPPLYSRQTKRGVPDIPIRQSPAVSPPKLVLIPDEPATRKTYVPTFNKATEKIDWAKWTWNPVTGCLHNCVYCYARDIANRHYPEKFEPTFHPERLQAPHYTKVPASAETEIGYRNVFVCSMADLFGKWVPNEWIDAVMAEVRAAPQWNFLFLTKFPQRLCDIEWPENAWVGTTVDEQYRVDIAEKALSKVQASVKWLSCEPLREKLTFGSLDMFDWVVIGGQSKSSQAPAMQPEWEWVEHLHWQARAAGCMVYWKPNLLVRPQEYPGF